MPLVFWCAGRAHAVDLAGAGTDDHLLVRMRAVFKTADEQYGRMLAALENSREFPRTFENGQLKTVASTNWTSGFFPGSLWLLYDYTRDEKWREAAKRYTEWLEPVKNHRGTHDVGFILECSYGNGWRLTTNGAYREVLIQGARSLASRFNSNVGAIRSWDHGTWKYPVIIDNMMNLELLMIASHESGEKEFRDIAVSHANRTLQNHFRADHSSFHLVEYDPATGAVVKKQTVQGAADGSAWARGQAWGLYGFTMMYRETRHLRYLTQATNIASFIMNHPRLPEDKVPYWDFDAREIPNAPRDASAAAVMTSALIELSQLAGGDFGKRCLDLARQQLLSLSSAAYLASPGENGNFLLKHSVGHMPKKSEVDVPLSYADYYFLEALLRYRHAAGR